MSEHHIQFEPIANGKECRVRCTKCQANAIFHTEEQPPVAVKDAAGKWALKASDEPFVYKGDDGAWTANAAMLDRWFGKSCLVDDMTAAEKLAEDITNPKPPIVLSVGREN